MARQTPEGLRTDVQQGAIPLQAALRIAGSSVSAVHWENETDKTVEFTPAPPGGGPVRHESRLVEKLQELLDTQ
jgi:hypothetical protein